jgi:hypothetical protein
MPEDILVDTTNPKLLDETVQTFGAFVMQGAAAPDYETHEGHYVVRSFTLPGSALADMITQQGYAEVIRVLDELL